MRQSEEGWGSLPVWSVAQVIGSNRSYEDRGIVIALGNSTVEVHWDGNETSVVYPQDALVLRKLLPWE